MQQTITIQTQTKRPKQHSANDNFSTYVEKSPFVPSVRRVETINATPKT